MNARPFFTHRIPVGQRQQQSRYPMDWMPPTFGENELRLKMLNFAWLGDLIVVFWHDRQGARRFAKQLSEKNNGD